MTRKRFCQKLMGGGISRNEARHIAQALPVGRSYEDHLLKMGIQTRMFACRFRMVIKPFLRAVQTVMQNMVSLASDAFTGLNEDDNV